MCEKSNKIIFCSCSTGDLDPPFPYWVLYREVGKSRTQIVGTFLPPEEPNALDQVTLQAVSDALNTESSFDFEYSPLLDDCFVLHLAENQKFFFTCDEDYRADDGSLAWRYNYFPMFVGVDFKAIESGKLVAR